jgi:hypothetical protein
MNAGRRLRELVGRVLGRRSSGERAAETDSEESASRYWRREVAEEKERRGTAEPREE